MKKHAGVLVVAAAMVLGLAIRADARDHREERLYFYLVTEIDQSLSLQTMTDDDARELKKTHLATYKEAAKAWGEAKDKWVKDTGSTKYPAM